MRVTIDTNIVDNDLIADLARRLGWDLRVVTVTERELESTSFAEQLPPHPGIPEVGVFDESRWDNCVWAGDQEEDCLEAALAIIGAGSFPSLGKRGALNRGQKRQLRDAMLLCTHIREGRDLLISDDRTAFVDEGRRDAFAKKFGVHIITSEECLSQYGRQQSAPTSGDTFDAVARDVLLRSLDESDADFLNRLEARSDVRIRIGGLNPRKIPGGLFRIVECRGQAAGLVAIVPTPLLRGDNVELVCAVDVVFENHGIGTQACQQMLEEYTSSADAKVVLAAVAPDNATARKLASKLGFTRMQEVGSAGEEIYFYGTRAPAV